MSSTSVNLITSAAPLLSGNLDECLSPDDETCVGGIAAVMAYVRSNTSTQGQQEPYVVIQKFDKDSPFVNMHPLQWVVNRLVFQEIFNFPVFMSQPSLLLQNQIDSQVSQRDISDLQTTALPYLISNVAVPTSNSWHPFVKSTYFDPSTGLAFASLADTGVPLTIDLIDAANGFLNYIQKINQENGCYDGWETTTTTTTATISYNDYLQENPPLEFGNTQNLNETVTNKLTEEAREDDSRKQHCWITVLLYSSLESEYVKFLDAITRLDDTTTTRRTITPDLVINLDYTYQAHPYPTLYNNTKTWVVSCSMTRTNYCQTRITLSTKTDQDQESSSPIVKSIDNIEFIGGDLETLPNELKDDEWRQNILQLRPLADIAQQNNPILGYTTTMPLSRIDDYRACQAGECPIGNLFTDAIRWFTGTDVAFTSSGGYRGEGWSAEDGVRFTDLYAALPFPNTGR
jgi:hypothetical protein